MATTPGIMRTIILVFRDNSNLDRDNITSNKFFGDSVRNGIADAITVSVRELRIFPTGFPGTAGPTFRPVMQIDILTNAAGDANIIAALPTLHIQLGLNDPVRSWSYPVTFGF